MWRLACAADLPGLLWIFEKILLKSCHMYRDAEYTKVIFLGTSKPYELGLKHRSSLSSYLSLSLSLSAHAKFGLFSAVFGEQRGEWAQKMATEETEGERGRRYGIMAE